MSKRYKVKIGSLRSVFVDDKLHAEIARLLVLYEDLKIERAGILQEISSFGRANNGSYVHRYFLRRAVATLFECGRCMASLNVLPEFKNLKRTYFSTGAVRIWDAAVKLISDKKSKGLIGSIRNEVGGHFGYEPAQRAVSSLKPGTTGKIEYCRDMANPKDSSFECHFVGEITARAFLKDPNVDPEKEYRKLMSVIADCHGAVLQAVPCLIASYLWPRFGTT